MVDLDSLRGRGMYLQRARPPAVRVVRGACLQGDERWQGATLIHPDLGFYLVDSKGMWAEADGRRWAYAPGRVTLIPPWWPYTYRFRPAMGHAFLHIEVADWPMAMLRKHLTAPLVLDDPALVADFRTWCDQLLARPSAELQHLHALRLGLALVGALLNAHPALRDEVLRSSGAWIHLRPALDLVDERLASPIAISELAKALGCSREQVARLFKRHLGQSPVRYIQERRISRAVGLLHGGSSVAEAAAAVGVGTPQYLARLVRRHLGRSPTEAAGLA